MRRRDKVLLGFSVSAFAGILFLAGIAAWYLWNRFVDTEREAVAQTAEILGRRVEYMLVDARDMLKNLNALPGEPCSDAHLAELDRLALSEQQIVSIGYWRAAERLCGAGFARAVRLKPSRADRIYDSGIIAWWPGPQTEVAGVQLFLMRYGDYDVAIDPRVLLPALPAGNQQVGLWVEGLRMAASPWTADLPAPQSVAPGLSVDQENGRLLARFSLDTVLPIDIVVSESIDTLWSRYWPTIAGTGAIVLVLAGVWIFCVLYYMRRRLSLPTELRESVAAGEIKVQYQPIVDLSTGKCIGGEALARWRREGGEDVSPETFIAAAEAAGLIPQITVAVLDAALNDLSLFLRKHPECRININLAPQDLENTEFAEALARRMREQRLSAECIRLEVTERALISSESGRRVINQLRENGHEVAIDDFGTGYSSLAYLQSFNLDTLKIDKAFVNAIGTEAVTSQVIHHVIELAKSLDLTIVAEGVETHEQARWLRSQGVKYAQGFLLSKPLWPRDFQQFFRANQDANLYPLAGAQGGRDA